MYASILNSSDKVDSELKWFRDVLLIFFETITHNKIIHKACNLFLNVNTFSKQKVLALI